MLLNYNVRDLPRTLANVRAITDPAAENATITAEPITAWIDSPKT
jgi:hypothetical protein